MPEVFKRTQLNFGGAMAADRGLLTISGGLSPVLIQNLSLSYSQQVTRLYELGLAGAIANMFYVGGRSQGQATIQRVVGPGVFLAAFYDRFGDVCMAGKNIIGLSLANACNTSGFGAITGAPAIPPPPPPVFDPVFGGPTKVAGGTPAVPGILLRFCVLQQVGNAVGAQDLIISENNQIMFGNMDYNGS